MTATNRTARTSTHPLLCLQSPTLFSKSSGRSSSRKQRSCTDADRNLLRRKISDTIEDSALDSLLHECQCLRGVVLQQEISRLRIPAHGQIVNFLNTLNELEKVVAENRGSDKLVSGSSTEENLLPVANRIVNQINATNQVRHEMVTVDELVRGLERDLQLLVYDADHSCHRK